MKLIRWCIFALITSIGFVGCKVDQLPPPEVKSVTTFAVVVGMENSRFAGSCPGAGYDADRMYKLLSAYTKNIVLYRDSNATKANVAAALNRAIENASTGLVIFCYSGHGGSSPFYDTGKEEVDGKDEYLCLYDTYMRDNEIWGIISRSKGRVFCIVDACHSQTMFRHVGFKMKLPLGWDHSLDEQNGFSLLCWSGCPDDTYSYGASNGGQFTNALLRHFNSTKTYETLWNEIKADKVLRSYENPQSTAIGNGFEGMQIFR